MVMLFSQTLKHTRDFFQLWLLENKNPQTETEHLRTTVAVLSAICRQILPDSNVRLSTVTAGQRHSTHSPHPLPPPPPRASHRQA
ncbi:hypothetical protein CEXT_595531 [Caerostris extrusa]|uniref:Uncharacterized protein n=1 Tax=Caerostris extrusa TaxID=172846 RepID=A0AAV4XZM8_CAEEX|nr:hypothetical protein CEXT_595531 [Caerostris extrusa]